MGWAEREDGDRVTVCNGERQGGRAGVLGGNQAAWDGLEAALGALWGRCHHLSPGGCRHVTDARSHPAGEKNECVSRGSMLKKPQELNKNCTVRCSLRRSFITTLHSFFIHLHRERPGLGHTLSCRPQELLSLLERSESPSPHKHTHCDTTELNSDRPIKSSVV